MDKSKPMVCFRSNGSVHENPKKNSNYLDGRMQCRWSFAPLFTHPATYRVRTCKESHKENHQDKSRGGLFFVVLTLQESLGYRHGYFSSFESTEKSFSS